MKTVHIVKDFTLIAEDYVLKKDTTSVVSLDQEALGFVFYASGKTQVNVSINNKTKNYNKNTGQASSFYYSPNDTTITHNISKKTALKKVSLFIPPLKLISIIDANELATTKQLNSFLNPDKPFVEGSSFNLNSDMLLAIQKIMSCQYTGIAHKLFLESQILELLSHYFNNINATKNIKKINSNQDVAKLYHAKELLLSKIDVPPSLEELAKLTGLNSFKLKSGFKELFGLPVYKYLHNKRMDKAYELLENKDLTVSEVAWYVGYNSLGSFSNSFYKKFGFRPSALK